MSILTDKTYLSNRQYGSSGNLRARIELHRRFSVNTRPWMIWVFDHFQFPRQAAILELGCGPGTLWLQNRNRVHPSWRALLSDLSQGMIREAIENVRPGFPTFGFAAIDAQAIPLRDASVDVVIANHMLYHVPDRELAFREIRRVLRPAGQLYAATVGRRHLAEIQHLIDQFADNPRDDVRLPEDGFYLDSGGREIESHFQSVELLPYEDRLKVTETGPLMDYILSRASGETLGPGAVDALRRHIDSIIRKDGFLGIRKETGLFRARRE